MRVTHPHHQPAAEVLRQLGTDAARGLDEPDAARRLEQVGPNELVERGIKSPWAILWEQLTGTMVVILILAAIVSAALGEFHDATAIGAIVILNAVLGLSQEYRAEKAMAALKRLTVPSVKVRREGRVKEVTAVGLAPGDIVLLEAGNLVPADCRLLECANLRIQEAALTGESEPVEKDARVLPGENPPLGDRVNMAYMGTVVTYGRGLCVVTETGMRTELGGIATMMQTVRREPTPLQRRLARLGRGLAVAALILVTVIFVQGLIRGGLGSKNVKEMFLTAISMAVAAVPEGLPAVVTIALALGAQRMLRRRALIRKLLAVETLGSVTVICSDKTGTLTENRMTVTILDVDGHQIDLREHLHRLEVEAVNGQADAVSPGAHPGVALLAAAGTLCNDAWLRPSAGAVGTLEALGDPTEAAMVLAAARLGLLKDDLERAMPRVAEVPFDSDRKRMTTIHTLPEGPDRLPPALRGLWDRTGDLPTGGCIAFTKGAVDSLLEVATRVWENGRVEPLTAPLRERIAAANDRLAGKGMRVLGVAVRPMPQPPPDPEASTVERELIFVGLVGMIDPPRAEVKDAVRTCKTAGIRPVMITGDHPLTAWHIAQELGMADDGRILTGRDLERMTVADLEQVVQTVPVYARVSPQHKLNIVQALQNRGHIVAMTGDGVNDAPALKKADIGVAMGVTGSDVSKEAADMVLVDDNFATIVAAVEEGRVIYDNIRKFIKYLLTTNSGEIWVMFLAPFLGMPLPLVPLQILWVNLVTDGLPALGLGVEPAEPGTMSRPPARPDASIFGQGMGVHILWVGMLMAAVSLCAAAWYWYPHGELDRFRTMVFTTVTLTQMAHVLAIRSGRESLFRAGLLSNKPLLGAVLLTVLLQGALIYVPFLQRFFQTTSLSALDLAISAGLSSIIFWAVEIEKLVLRRGSGPASA
jgi:Ca2+-transporting ATPase